MADKPELHQLLAVRKDRAERANSIADESKEVLKSKHLFNGSHRSYKPFDEIEPGQDKNADLVSEPDVEEKLSYTVGEKLAWFLKEFGKLIDLDYQIDKTNQQAVADLVCGDLEIENVPAPFLMDLIGHLERMKKVMGGIQVLDPKIEWMEDDSRGEGVWKSANDQTSYRLKKMHKHKILTDATEHHPAQIHQWTEDQRIGKFTTKFWSGAVTAHQKAELLKAVDQLLVATKKALSRANQAEHATDKIASKISGWLVAQSHIKTGGVAKG